MVKMTKRRVGGCSAAMMGRGGGGGVVGSRGGSGGGGVSRHRGGEVVSCSAAAMDDDFAPSGGGGGDEDVEGFGPNFGDIDRLAAEEENAARAAARADDDGGEEEEEEEKGEWDLMSPGSSDVVEFGLSGRPLYVCQAMWWLRLSQLKTYPPGEEEVTDIARRSGLAPGVVDKWFTDALDHYHSLPLADKANYDIESEAKLVKLEELVEKLGEDQPGVFMGRDDDPVNLEAPWNPDGRLTYEEQEKLTYSDPLFMTMTDLPGVMRDEAAAARQEQEVEEGLDDDAIARIPQDGTAEKPFLINPYTHSKAGTWSIAKNLGPPDEFEESMEWMDDGGWEALPDHEVVSAVDGGALTYIGVNNDQHVPRDLWKLDSPHNRDALEVAEEVDSDGIMRDALKHIGDVSRKQLHHLEIGEELEGEIVAVELYHGALVDCGCETDALIPISEQDWPEVRDALTIGTKVRVKVSAVHQKWWRFRFPIELNVVDPAVGHLIKEHPHETPPINIYSGETVPYANLDAGRSLDRFVANHRNTDEETKKQRRAAGVNEWVQSKYEESEIRDAGKKGKGNRMQRVLAQAAAAAAAANEEKLAAGAGASSSGVDDEDDDGLLSDGGAAAALDSPSGGMRAIGERTEDQIAAEEEEEEEALFGGGGAASSSSKDGQMAGMAGQREDPDVVEEGDDEEARVDTAADDNMAMNLNPEAEDTRGGVVGIINGVDDFEPAPGDIDDDDDDMADDDDDDDDDDEKPMMKKKGGKSSDEEDDDDDDDVAAAPR